VTAERRREFDAVLASALAWAGTQPSVAALGLAGSWARAAATMSSDVDLVVLSDERQHYLTSTDWVAPALGSAGQVVRTQAWGPLTERRIRLPSGFLVECGFAPRRWASVAPLDEGTVRVVADGFAVLYDPEGLLERLVTAVAARP
jgi:uncharacterized protein